VVQISVERDVKRDKKIEAKDFGFRKVDRDVKKMSKETSKKTNE